MIGKAPKPKGKGAFYKINVMKPGYKKIQFTKSPTGKFNLAYFAGDVVEMPANQAEVLIEHDFAVEVTPEIYPKDDLPPDVPARDKLLAAGVKSIEELKLFDDLTEIPGVGKKLAEQIVAYLNK